MKSASKRQGPKRPKDAKIVHGADGRTVGGRIRHVMDLDKVSETEIFARCRAIAGDNPDGTPFVSQQMINAIKNDKVGSPRSGFLPVIAEALDVRAVWLQLGKGDMRQNRALAQDLLNVVRRHIGKDGT